MEVEENIPQIDIIYNKRVKSNKLIQLSTSERTNEVLRLIWSSKIELCEEFVLLLLNRANKCLGYIKMSQGGICGTVVDSKLILGIALKSAATGIIISHNHPSGNAQPSMEDIKLTKRLNECCRLFGIQLLDHVIISGDTEHYYSFADEGAII